MFTQRPFSLGLLLVLGLQAPAGAWEWSGYVAAEGRSFFQDGLAPEQRRHDISLVLQPELYHAWNRGYESILFVPALRWDRNDPERSHGDIRELFWQKAARDWELKLGIGKVFWGVTESQHLVDVINQTDLVDNLDGEDKLGQPLGQFSLIQSWGVLHFFALPGFRERTFPGPKGRLRSLPAVDTDQARYESGAEDKRLDWAARYQRSVGPVDLGLAHFQGTSREPRLQPFINDAGQLALRPFYDVINQSSLDGQLVWGSWLWKLEVIGRSGQGKRFTAATGGFEYTFSNLGGTGADVGILLEYLYDDRRGSAPTPFEDDFFAGTRLALNDTQSTDLLAGVLKDRKTGGHSLRLEASRRLGNRWKLTVEGQSFSGHSKGDLLFGLRQDDFVQWELARYF